MRHLSYIVFNILLLLAAPAMSSASLVPSGLSLNWAGYVAQRQNFSGVSGTWQVPKVTAAKQLKTDATWVGIGGVSSTDLIQAGTEAITGVPGKIGYLAWYELLPDFSKPVPLAVQAGDSVTIDIKKGARNSWKILFSNNTSGQNYEQDVKYNSSGSSAEWIEEMPSTADSNLIPLDNFGLVRFSNGFAVVAGKRLSIKKSGASPLDLAGNTGKILAAVSALNRGGTGFTVKRLR